MKCFVLSKKFKRREVKPNDTLHELSLSSLQKSDQLLTSQT